MSTLPMATSTVHLRSTPLDCGTLWYDGHLTVVPDAIEDMVLKIKDVSQLCVTEITPEITQYNALVPPSEKITTKSTCDPLSTKWKLPKDADNLDVEAYVIEKFMEQPNEVIDNPEYPRRIAYELELFKHANMFDVLRAVIFVINTFQTNNQVWGVGRGSSVSSYVLFIIGVHDVDSVAYDLDVTDFIKNK